MKIEEIQIELLEQMAAYFRQQPEELKKELDHYLENPAIEEAWKNKRLGEMEFQTGTTAYLEYLAWLNSVEDYADIAKTVLRWTRGICLDFGGGIGTMSKILQGHSKMTEIHYYDINISNRAFAKNWLEGIIIHDSFSSIFTQKYNTIILMDVIGYLSNYEDVLTALINTISKTDRIILTCPFDNIHNLSMYQEHFKNLDELEARMKTFGLRLGKKTEKIFEFWKPK